MTITQDQLAEILRFWEKACGPLYYETEVSGYDETFYNAAHAIMPGLVAELEDALKYKSMWEESTVYEELDRYKAAYGVLLEAMTRRANEFKFIAYASAGYDKETMKNAAITAGFMIREIDRAEEILTGKTPATKEGG